MSTPTKSPLLAAKSRNDKWANVPAEIRIAGKAISAQMGKHGILEGTQVRVCVALDVSGSMQHLYSSGKVQALLVNALGMAACLDDDGEIEIFPFGETCEPIPVKADFKNFQTVIQDQIWRNGNGCLGGTSYTAPVMSIRHAYFKSAGFDKTIQTDQTPVFAIFVTDGAPGDSHQLIKDQFEASSYQPIFWKIITLGRVGFDLLQSIDDAPSGPGKRLLDNSDFKSIDEPEDLTAAMLVDELPMYLLQAHQDYHLFTQPPVLNEELVREQAATQQEEEVRMQAESKGCCAII